MWLFETTSLACGFVAASAMLALVASNCTPSAEPPGRSMAAPAAELLLPFPTAMPEEAFEPVASKEALRPGQGDKLASIAMHTFVYMEPERRSNRLGYLRAGTVIDRAAAPAGYNGCPGGWFAIDPRGYVCNGKTATLDIETDIVAATPHGPRRGEPYPYQYVISRAPPPHLYVHLPTLKEQRHVEGRYSHDALPPRTLRDQTLLGDADSIPPFFTSGRDLPKPLGAFEKVRFPAHRGRAKFDSAFGLIATFHWTGRRFGLTTELDLIPIDRTSVAVPSNVKGVVIDGPGTPAFVMHHGVKTLTIEESGKLSAAGWAAHRSGWVLTGKTAFDGAYVETTQGVWIPESSLRIARLGRDLWGYASRGKKWIDISIELQMLVAYEGTQPVFATLVSTGRGKLLDHQTTSATIQGTFFVREKHISATMDGNDLNESAFDLKDVPYVQYFHNNYALHGAYWHDDFGKVHSSGCVNLSPADAAWLFEWTDPIVPQQWHGAFNKKSGTLIYIHA